MTHTEVMEFVASLQNDSARNEYTDAVVLPYYNLARSSLKEIFQLNNVGVTNETSAAIQVDAGDTVIGFSPTVPTLPSGLVEIRQVWERLRDTNPYTPMDRVDFLPHNLEDDNSLVSRFGIWAWENQEIRLLESNQDNDIKLDYIQDILASVDIADVGDEIVVKNVNNYLIWETGAFCSMFIGENETRALAQETKAQGFLYSSLGISAKGQQSIVTRRRPFRAAFKRRAYF